MIIGDLLRNIPVGFKHHKEAQCSMSLDGALKEPERYEKDKALFPEIEAGYFQTGTLGGGNHFIVLQEDEEGYLCIMIHSGSRHLGKKICDHFNKIAKELNTKWCSSIPPEYRLAFLPTDSEEGNPESFSSSSHGAGRRYSRTTALKTFTAEEAMLDLKNQGVLLGKNKKSDVAEESHFAYKDIDEVMANQCDLVTPISKLKTIGVVKG